MPDMSRKFKIDLTKRERRELEALVRKQSIGAALQRRARILLLADAKAGWHCVTPEVDMPCHCLAALGQAVLTAYDPVTKWPSSWIHRVIMRPGGQLKRPWGCELRGLAWQ